MPLAAGLDKVETLTAPHGWAELEAQVTSGSGLRAVGELGWKPLPWLTTYGQGWVGKGFHDGLEWGAGVGVRAQW